MSDLDQMTHLLVDLGLGKTEAAAYLQLLLMAGGGPATGYQVARRLGKDPNTVYRALDDLEKRGAVEVSLARGREYRAIPVEMLTEILKNDYADRILYTVAHLRALPRPAPSHEVFQIPTAGAARERFGALLAGCRRVAVLDLAPDLLARFAAPIGSALARGVTVVARLYRAPEGEIMAKLPHFIFTVEPEGDLAQELLPGQVLRGVFDCAAQLTAYLREGPAGQADGAGRPPTQAVWTTGPLLAYQGHHGLAGEIIHTELRAMLRRGCAPDEMRARQDWLARKIHGPVDWEEFWARAGLGGGGAAAAPVPVRETGPGPGSLTAELLARKRRAART